VSINIMICRTEFKTTSMIFKRLDRISRFNPGRHYPGLMR
jgi:hypothetical protein